MKLFLIYVWQTLDIMMVRYLFSIAGAISPVFQENFPLRKNNIRLEYRQQIKAFRLKYAFIAAKFIRYERGGDEALCK